MANEKQVQVAGIDEGAFEMNRTWGTIAMIISATGMGLVPLFSRWGTRVDMFGGGELNAGDSIGALMAVGRMTMGFIFFVALLFINHKVGVFKKMKVTPSIILGGVMIGASLACYVTATLLTTVANSVLFIYTGPIIMIILARIFRKEPISPLQAICIVAVIIGTLFGNNIIGFGADGAFRVEFSLEMSTPEFPQKGIGDIFGLLSGVFYGSSMFFNLYRKDADTTARGVWNFLAAALAALVICLTMNFLGESGIVPPNWALNIHLTPFNWIGAVLLWIISGAVALGMLLVAGRNLPAADYGCIAYWEVPVALFVGLVVFGEALTINTIIGGILIIGGGAIPAVKGIIEGNRHNKEVEIREHLSEKLAEEEAKANQM